MEKIKTLAIAFLSILSCRTSHIAVPDALIIYKLPQFNSYLVSVSCEQVKMMKNVNKTVISDKAIIKEFVTLLEDNSNFKLYKDTSGIDSRILIEYIYKGKIINEICWSRTNLIQKGGRIYSYNQKIEDYLLKSKLIIKINE